MTAALPHTLEYPFPAPPGAGAAMRVAPGVLWLRMPLPFALDHVNLWVLEDDSGCTLVDCGIASEATRTLWDLHARDTVRGRRVERVIATHYHPDHVGNAEWLMRRFGCPLLMTHAEFLTAHAVADGRAGHGVGHMIAWLERHGLTPAHAAALRERGNAYRSGVPTLPDEFTRLVEGDRVLAAGATWRVLVGRGHSPEHACLWNPDAGVLIGGDMLLPRISTNVSVTAAEPDGDPLQCFLDALDCFESLPSDTLVLPSHGLPFRGIPLRVTELRAHHAARLREIERAVEVDGPSSAADLVPLLFRRELDTHQRFFALGEAVAHLNRLWHSGRLARLQADGEPCRFAPP